MSVIGSSAGWFDLLDQMLPDLLALIIDSWSIQPGSLHNDREDTITDAFCQLLRRNRTLREMPFLVDSQWVELNPAPGQRNQRRLDITFRPTGGIGAPSEDIYFCLECKRLSFLNSGRRVSGGAEYVRDGMMRFVDKQYAKSVRYGAMVGYVLDGNVSKAIKNVENNIKRHYMILCMDKSEELQISSILPKLETIKETSHRRQDETIPFQIHHIFLNADHLCVFNISIETK